MQRVAGEIRLSVAPFDGVADRQALTVRLNDRVLGRHVLQRGWQDVVQPVDATAWRAGANILEFAFATSGRLAPGGMDDRDLAVAFSGLELGRGVAIR